MKQFNVEEYRKNPSKKVITRDGRDVRIICTDFDNPDFPIIVGIKGSKWPCSFATNGESIKGRKLSNDLFFAPNKHTDYINLYHSESGYYLGTAVFSSKEEAEGIAAGVEDYITTIKAEWEE